MLLERRPEPPAIGELQACARLIEVRLVLAQQAGEVREYQSEMSFWKSEANRAADEARQALERLAQVQAVLNSVLSSTSWRVMHPLRQAFLLRTLG